MFGMAFFSVHKSLTRQMEREEKKKKMAAPNAQKLEIIIDEEDYPPVIQAPPAVQSSTEITSEIKSSHAENPVSILENKALDQAIMDINVSEVKILVTQAKNLYEKTWIFMVSDAISLMVYTVAPSISREAVSDATKILTYLISEELKEASRTKEIKAEDGGRPKHQTFFLPNPHKLNKADISELSLPSGWDKILSNRQASLRKRIHGAPPPRWSEQKPEPRKFVHRYPMGWD